MIHDEGEHEAELIPQRSTFVESQSRGEVDMQVATARRFPRSIKAFRERALALATLDEDTAAGCFYVLPPRKGGDGKSIEGPSVRLAEIVAASWGNLRAQASIVDEEEEYITVQGRCWDLETNTAVAMEVRRRITGKDGRRYSPDMINTTANAACSIAFRNAVFRCVPMAMVRPIEQAARKVAIGDAETLVVRRAKAFAYWKKVGISSERICQKFDRASIDDITLDDLGVLLGLFTAIRDGETSLDEAFPTDQVADVKSRSEHIVEKHKKQHAASGNQEPSREPGQRQEATETPQKGPDKTTKPQRDVTNSLADGLSRRIHLATSAKDLDQLSMEVGESLADGGLSQHEADALRGLIKDKTPK